MKKNYFRKTLALSLGTLLLFIGAAMHVKLNIGLSAFDALGLTLTYIFSSIRLGRMFMIMNSIFFLIQLSIERKNFELKQLLQIPHFIFGGYLMDFILETFFANFQVDNYILIIILFVFALVLKIIGVIFILESHFFRLTLEGTCVVVKKFSRLSLGTIRTIFEAIFILLAVSLTLIYSLEWTVREGTIITLLIQGPMLDLFIKPTRKLFQTLGVTDYNTLPNQ